MPGKIKKKSPEANSHLLYSADQTPPALPLILFSLQHMLLVISMGLALPVSIARSLNMDAAHSASFLAASLFCMGIATVLQTINGKFIGSGYQSFSACDSASISACVLAAEVGGVPLVLGMTVFAGVFRFIVGSFAFKMRKLFPPDVTGTMIFILGVNLVPTGFKYFLGSAVNGVYNPMHLVVAGATLAFMLVCALFIKPLKPYTALAGMTFGYVLSLCTGILDPASFASLGQNGVVALPIYSELSFSFDPAMIMPFLIVAIADIADNIGDIATSQSINNAASVKTDWRSIERGIRGGALGVVISGLLGGTVQSTATVNIGIAGANGVTSRKVAYVGAAFLIIVAFFPALSGVLAMIPEPVLGAVLLYSMCYLMSGGFSSIASRELDTRRIFTIFLSIGAAISTLIPGLYSFMPESVSRVLVTPMVMGVSVLIITTLICRIGTKKKFTFVTGVSADDVASLNKELESVCAQWQTDKMLLSKLKICLNALCEGFFEEAPDAKLHLSVAYDGMQLKMGLESEGLPEKEADPEEISSLSIALSMLPNMFDHVSTKWQNGVLNVSMDADI